ncbi:hypothetical protein Acr_23g0021460 [Actinidia rufa]|uniref:Uncharacterized protein n=1 Tax=Actinidia rufa TaxID=165716 RepID=A0A7J0GSS6_9ERIC|nr:hypothetical protein Acr_23g0021460 [Actinidia rufa]
MRNFIQQAGAILSMHFVLVEALKRTSEGYIDICRQKRRRIVYTNSKQCPVRKASQFLDSTVKTASTTRGLSGGTKMCCRSSDRYRSSFESRRTRRRWRRENRSDSDDLLAALLKPPSVWSSSPPRPPPTAATNFDRLVESFTPYVNAKFLSEVNSKGRKNWESDTHLYYCLGDLWESLAEWSAYGVGVPLVLNGKDPITQYYVPSLSGIQLHGDQVKSPSRLR